ncbi:MAG: amidohydrolase family protein [Gemmataceae bacterium]
MPPIIFHNGALILEDRILRGGSLEVDGPRITAIHPGVGPAGRRVDLEGGYVAPGFVDLHVHGGDGADFMDGTQEAFRTACRAHLRHGTTSLVPTTTVGRHDQHLAFLELCRRLKPDPVDGARILGAHFYGPYFAYEARGAHPGAGVRPRFPWSMSSTSPS